MKLGYYTNRDILDFILSFDEVELYSFRWKVGSTRQLLNCHVYARPFSNNDFKIKCYSAGRYPALVFDTAWTSLSECYRDLIEYSNQNQL